MALEYARRGLIGCLTPQANTTVEPEFWILIPPGYAFINGRLMSAKPTLEARLADYFEHLDAAMDQFANAPINAYAVACTGASYIVGLDQERELVASLERKYRKPVITAGLAVADALKAINAKRIALISPYPESLGRKSVAYWSEHGFDVGAMIEVSQIETAFHPIYAMPGADAQAALAQVTQKDIDAVLMLGTGMPTLSAIARSDPTARPVLSCMVCLAWATIAKLGDAEQSAGAVEAFLNGRWWRDRLSAAA